MREDGTGRDTMFPWSNAPAAPAYAVGDTVCSGDNPEPGTVVSVGETTLGIIWSDGAGEITYPIDAPYLRKKLPWE